MKRQSRRRQTHRVFSDSLCSPHVARPSRSLNDDIDRNRMPGTPGGGKRGQVPISPVVSWCRAVAPIWKCAAATSWALLLNVMSFPFGFIRIAPISGLKDIALGERIEFE